ncbi:MAG: HAMP domain-containing histidine kinase, partial [Chitinophagaceae bacterium]
MGHMSRLMNKTIRTFLIYAAIVLVCSIPAYYYTIRWFWDFEVDEHNIIVSEEASMHDAFMILSSVTVLTTVFFVVLLTGFVLLNKAISRKLWAPFYTSLDQIRNFNLTENKDLHFEDTDIDEFTKLHHSLNKLIAGNIAAYSQQKEFADNASHELQTPIAIVQSKLGMLLQSKSLTREQFDTIEEALTALSRVTRINKNLLLLTKIENSQYQDQEDLTDIVRYYQRLDKIDREFMRQTANLYLGDENVVALIWLPENTP